MNIVQPYVKILGIDRREDGIALLRHVEYAARISHRSEEAQTETSWERFITSVVLGHGDWSVTEHASVSVEAVVDRGVMAEWTRHRIGAYTVESTRFCNYEKRGGLSFIEPPEMINTDQAIGWRDAIQTIEATYGALIASGNAPQLARSVLPMSLATKMLVTYNLRSWRHWLLMRSTKEAHPQIRALACELLGQFQTMVPLLYDDIEPGARQIDNLSKPR